MIKQIENKIQELRNVDKQFKVFGSENHKYQFKNKISYIEVSEFEKQHKIELPEFYREFILHFGSQGCGPGYGLLNFNKAVLGTPSSPNESDKIKLSNNFKFKSKWNIEYKDGDYGNWEKEYFGVNWIDGSMRISHQGCGYYTILIVSGSEKGYVWLDARASDEGIFPIDNYKGEAKTTFGEWYINWLDASINKMKKTGNTI